MTTPISLPSNNPLSLPGPNYHKSIDLSYGIGSISGLAARDASMSLTNLCVASGGKKGLHLPMLDHRQVTHELNIKGEHDGSGQDRICMRSGL